jgi:hypothetical protein
MSAIDDWGEEPEVLGSSEPASNRVLIVTRFPAFLPQWQVVVDVASKLQELRSAIEGAASEFLSAVFQPLLNPGPGVGASQDDSADGDFWWPDEPANPEAVEMVVEPD